VIWSEYRLSDQESLEEMCYWLVGLVRLGITDLNETDFAGTRRPGTPA
jgi:hypothetical protein